MQGLLVVRAFALKKTRSDLPFIGANQTTILFNIFELKEQMTPMIIKRRMASKTVCNALLQGISCNSLARSKFTYGE